MNKFLLNSRQIVLDILVHSFVPKALSTNPKGVHNLTFSWDLSVNEIPNVFGPIGPGVGTLAIDFVVLKLAKIRVASTHGQLAGPVSLWIDEVSVIDISVSPFLDALAIEQALGKATLVSLSILPVQESLSMVHIVTPAALIDYLFGL